MKIDIQARGRLRRGPWHLTAALKAGSALGRVLPVALLALPQVASAANECGAVVAGQVTCMATGNPYPNGITYKSAGSIALTTNSDVKISRTLSATSSGNVTITNNGAIAATGSAVDGIFAGASGGDVVVTTGTLSANGAGAVGINVLNTVSGSYFSEATGTAKVTATGTITSGGQGIHVTADKVVVDAQDINAGGTGIFVGSVFGSPSSVDITFGSITSNDIQGYSSSLNASSSGTVSISGSNITNSAYGLAINAFASKALTIVMSGTISSPNGAGIGAYDGDINITLNNSHTSTYAVSVYAPEVAITLKGSVTSERSSTYGTTHAAIIAMGSDRDGIPGTYDGISSIVTNNGTISTKGDNNGGIYVSAFSYLTPATTGAFSATVAGTGAITTSGAGAHGILAATSIGSLSLSQAGITTTGANSDAVLATATGNGNITIAVGSLNVSGSGSSGVVASGGGAISVTSGTASALDAPVIKATSSAGAVAITLNGATKTGNADAILIDAGTLATLNLGSSGSLDSTSGDALLTSKGGATLNNSGVISGNAAHAIVSASGGAFTFNNSGTFAGLLGFTGSSDAVNNSGTFNAAVDQDFGGGTDSFVNSGKFNVLGGAAGAGTVKFTALERFANTGLVSLGNGHSGDVLSLSGAFSGSGASTLAVDVGPTGADKLVAAGAITGTTALAINKVSGEGISLQGGGSIFAVGGAGSSPTAFILADQLARNGFIQFGIGFDVDTGSYSLAGIPTDAVFRTLKIAEGDQQLWYISADAWSAHMSDLREPTLAASSTGRLWGQFFGQSNRRESDQTFSVFGQSRVIDLSYKQNVLGGQIGYDLVRGDEIVFGVTGGYLNSHLYFDNVGDRATYNVENIGLYASYRSDGFFINGLANYGHSRIGSRSTTAGYEAKLDGNTYGVQGELGYRAGSADLYIEPIATLAYTRSDIDNLSALGATFEFNDLNGLRGKLGARIGGTFSVGQDATALLYAEANYVHEFDGKPAVTFSDNGDTLSFRNGRIGDYAEAKLGLSANAGSNVRAFVEGFGDFSTDYNGGGGRVGISIVF